MDCFPLSYVSLCPPFLHFLLFLPPHTGGYKSAQSSDYLLHVSGTQVSLSEVYTCFTELHASTDFIYVVPSIWCLYCTSLPLYQWHHLFCNASLERREDTALPAACAWWFIGPRAGLWRHLASQTCCTNRGSGDRPVCELSVSWALSFSLCANFHGISPPQTYCTLIYTESCLKTTICFIKSVQFNQHLWWWCLG